MWRDLRTILEGWGFLPFTKDRLTIHGHVRSDRNDHGTLLNVSIGDAPGSRREIPADGHFHLDLPMDRVVELVILRHGHFTRLLEIRPTRTSLRFARDPFHAQCSLDVVLTRRHDAAGGEGHPLLERIIMPKGQRPMIVEWDHVLRMELGEDFVPLFTRG